MDQSCFHHFLGRTSSFWLAAENSFAPASLFLFLLNCKQHTAGCTGEYDPVCASNAKTYDNECIFCNEDMCFCSQKNLCTFNALNRHPLLTDHWNNGQSLLLLIWE
ncbi:uncharacterized protein LOC110259535 isoform X2 [Sus scrofa]|uniref:uncharacterized protein LOC110259535 isoform X2 n=1 Tax=Sus scrofa TaxID=9823 RepID=UPI000A2B27D9|nr:uncharacterized protein LOC110259535 isoform X2 [Sus scrofa]XP_020940629.1 uncharacterized protein LOC110259535 isoform X2 [Sus scrofa]XP_020940630.1 uncharacterized protein LOC110259535 isoform X2 [Sus scrofa]XP_020940631.1 uncharacterized protein LOC110259535 isoform X2 [Sus scrofa]XP_020940632.1 uncharacterized protein LOC110259535 isoform X2 [Sus scrofa]XP_020940633.1 uncharacterized protein LOC110259535 isoform X2 [Sus scrofa]